MDITQVAVALISLITVCITTFLIPYIKSKTTSEKINQLNAFVTIAVGAAEQLFNSEQGKEKKDYVLKYLEDNGLFVDAETVDMMIENAVLMLHNSLSYSPKVE